MEWFARNGDGEWEAGLLEEGESLDLRCGDYHAQLDLARIYEDVPLATIHYPLNRAAD